jgi:thiol-disulfide isomerase/thioredoxin
MFLPTTSSLFLYFVILSLTILHSVSSFGIFPTKTFLQKTITRKLPPRQTTIQSKELFRLYGGKSSQVIEIGSLSQLEDILASAEKDSKLVVLDFTASWCPPCKMISPIFAKLAESKEFDGKAIFAKVINSFKYFSPFVLRLCV